MKRFHAVPATDERYVLGEGPFWDADRHRVLWVDISAGEVYGGTIDDGRVNPALLLTLPGTVGAVVSSAGGELLVAGPDRLYTASPRGDVTASINVPPSPAEARARASRTTPSTAATSAPSTRTP